MSDKMNITSKGVGEKDFKEIKAAEVLNFLKRYAKLQWDKGRRRTRQLFPTFDIISKNCHMQMDNTKIIMDYLEEKGEIKRYMSQRYLKSIWNQLYNQKNKPVIIEEKKQETIKETKIEKQKANIFQTIDQVVEKFKIVFLKTIMLIIAIIATYVSIDFTYQWFTSMFGLTKSLLLSLCIVGTSITSFEMVILFKQDKNYIGVVLFSLLWLGVVLFSITTGLSGQLNSEVIKKIQYETSNIKDDSKILLFKQYEKEINDYEIDIKAKRLERDKLHEFLLTMNYDNTNDKNQYNNINYKIYLKDKYINDIKNKIEILQKKKETLLKENIKLNVTKKISFFDWLEKLFKIKADKFKFVLYLILAVFVDVIAPVNFSIVLFYKRRMK